MMEAEANLMPKDVIGQGSLSQDIGLRSARGGFIGRLRRGGYGPGSYPGGGQRQPAI